MNVTPELISAYVDGEATPEEARLVEEAISSNPEVASGVDDLNSLAELFGHVEPEEVSEALKDRLYRLRPVEPLESFEPVVAPVLRRSSWLNWAVGAAAAALIAVGIQTLAHRPEVVLHDFLRQTLGADGDVVATEHFAQRKVRAGDLLKAEARERISYRAGDGSVVVLMPGGALEVGDTNGGELFELHRGTVLCTIHARGEARRARAAGYTIHADEADFGLRLLGEPLRGAGAPAGRAKLVVAVRQGSLEVGSNGDRAGVEADERVVLSPGAPVERSRAWDDPLYRDLLGRVGHELIPGYFDVEAGVSAVSRGAWYEEGGKRILVLTDSNAAAVAYYLVVQVKTKEPVGLSLTRVRPYADRPGLAETVTIEARTDARGIAAFALDAFDAPGAERADRKVPPARSRLVRLELGTSHELKASLWAARPPAGLSEVSR